MNDYLASIIEDINSLIKRNACNPDEASMGEMMNNSEYLEGLQDALNIVKKYQ
ncbi:MAG: hypothetical protein RSF40_01380 [Oscillospiraceae bacterium]